MSNPEIGVLLLDRPLEDSGSDKFGYSAIATNLVDLIRKAPTPLTIGLYGQWGVGKSTICKSIEREFTKTGDFKVFYFDTWKYERDSFRRQFLIELDKEVFGEQFDYKHKLNQSLTLPYIPPFWEAFWKSIDLNIRIIFTKLVIPLLLLLIAVGILLLGNSYAYQFVDANFESNLRLLIESFTTFGVALYIGKFILTSIQVYKGEVEVSKTDSAEGFEDYFKEALELLVKRQHHLLVIIDNLDRLDHKKAVEHLSDIKTFLASEKVGNVKNDTIFLIPCDNEALSTQLRQVNPELDTEEYLRKFFNVSFRIPRLMIPELDDYIATQLEKTKILAFADNYSLSFVISRAFQNNPRQIIQFINSLTTTYLLAEKRKLTAVTSKDGAASLARVLVIRARWPEIYSEVENVVLRSAKNLTESIEELRKEFSHISDIFNDFENFVTATDVVPIPEGQEMVFFALKELEGQSDIPEWSAFIGAAENRDETNTKETFEKVAKNTRLQNLNSLLLSYVQRNKGKDAKIANVFLSLAQMIDATNIRTFLPFIHDVLNTLPIQFISSRESDFDFRFIFNDTFKEINTQVSKNIIGKISYIALHMSSSEKTSEAVVEESLKLWDLIDQNSTIFSSEEIRLLQAKNQYLRNIKIPPIFQSTPFDYKGFVAKLADFAYRQYPQNKSLFLSIATFSFMALQQPTLHQPNVGESQELKTLLKGLAEYLRKNRPFVQKNTPEYDPLRQLTSQLLALWNINDMELRSLILQSLVNLAFPDNPQRAEIYERIGSFIENPGRPPEKAEEAILETFGADHLIKMAQEENRIKQSLIQRTGHRPNLFMTLKLGLDFFTEEKWRQILNQLVSGNAVGFNELVAYLDFKIPENIQGDISIAVIRNLNQSDPSIVAGFMEFLNRIGLITVQVPELLQALRNVNAKGGEHSQLVKNFVQKHISTIGKAQAEEFLK